jgi:hypothetical protein
VGVRYYQLPPQTIQKSTLKNILFQKRKTETRVEKLSFNRALHTLQGLFLFACESRLNQVKKVQKMPIKWVFSKKCLVEGLEKKED